MSKTKCRVCGKESEIRDWRVDADDKHGYTICPECGERYIIMAKKSYKDGKLIGQKVVLVTEEEYKQMKVREN